MERTKIDVYLERLVVGVLFVSEFAGFQVAVFTPNIFIPISLLVLWILIQGGVSFALLSQGWHAVRARNKEAWRLLNMAVVCILLQGLGVFHSHQLFAGAAAIADSFLLYLMYHWD